MERYVGYDLDEWVDLWWQEMQHRAARSINLNPSGGDAQVIARPVILLGISAYSSAGTGIVELFHGQAASGDIAGHVGMTADAVDHVWFGPDGIWCPAGLFAHFIGGVTTATAYVRDRSFL